MDQSSQLNKYFTLLIYVSLVFLVVFLYRSDLLSIDIERINGTLITVSLVFLFAGFALNAVCWFFYCRRLSEGITMVDAFVSHGLSIFGKYIPGKIWVILGRAAYFSSLEISLGAASQMSLYTQLVAIWVGLLFGVVGIAIIDMMAPILWLLLPVWILAGVGLFIPVLSRGEGRGRVVKLVARLNALGDYLTPGYIVSTVPLFLLMWFSWTAGFLLLSYAVASSDTLSWQIMFAFPFAATIGIIAIVFPGGLGVREGLIVYYMVQAGVPVSEATLVSILARIWFLGGEVFSFVMALVLRMCTQKKS